jgi:hypothetical protein
LGALGVFGRGIAKGAANAGSRIGGELINRGLNRQARAEEKKERQNNSGVDDEAKRISRILNPINNFRENRAYKKEEKEYNKQAKQDLKDARKEYKQDLREARKNQDLTYEERQDAHEKLSEIKSEDKDNRWYNKAGKSVGSKVNNSSKFYDNMFGSDVTPNIDLLFFLALAIHVIDWVTGFNRQSNGMLYPMFGLYIFLALFAVLWVFNTGFGRDTSKYVGLSLFTFFLPFITTYVQTEWVGGVLIFTPVWVLYLMLHPGGSRGIAKFGKWYINFWIIIGLISFTMNITFADGMQSRGIDPVGAFQYVVEVVSKPIKTAWEGTRSLPGKIELAINQSVGSSYYAGEVENSKEAPIGVYLEDIRPAEPTFYEGSPVTIWANIRGKSFKGKIIVNNRCKTKDGVYGTIDPVEPLEMIYEEQNTIACNFENGFNAGDQKITISSTFNFETWGYLTYTFVDKDTYRSYYSQNRDIHAELDIDEEVDPIFTNGPVGIGMLALDQPVVVDTTLPASNEQDSPVMLPAFGVTLENKWSHGKIEKVENFEIRAPEGIGLTRCDHSPTPDSPRFEDGFNVYEFRIQNPKQSFTSVTCRLFIPDAFRALEFLGTGDKAIKTFVVTSKYIYTVEKELTIDVEEWT